MVISGSHRSLDHLYLWKAGIEHRDINTSNITYNELSGKKAVHDSDMFQLRLPGQFLPTRPERTGAAPFMALELLSLQGMAGRVRHSYHHDCESFSWVLLWICYRFKTGVEIKPPPLTAFQATDYVQRRLARTNGTIYRGVWPTSSFKGGKGIVSMKLSLYWRDRYRRMEIQASEREIERRAQTECGSQAIAIDDEIPETDEHFLGNYDDALRKFTPGTPTLMAVVERDFSQIGSTPVDLHRISPLYG